MEFNSFKKGIVIQKRTLLDGAVWGLLAKVIGSFGLLLISAILTRILKKEDVGVFMLLLNFVFIIAALCQAGINSIVIKKLGVQLAKVNLVELKNIIYNAIFIVMTIATMFSLAYVLFLSNIFVIFLKNEIFSSFKILIAAWIVIRCWQILSAEIFRGLHKLRAASIYSGAATNIGGLIAGCLIYVNLKSSTYFDLEHWIKVWVAISFLVAVSSFYFLYRSFASINGRFSTGLRDITKYLYESFPVCLSAMAVIFVSRSDLWVVGSASDADSLASYAIAGQLALTVGVLISVVNGVISPMIPNYITAGRKKEMEEILRGATTISAVVSLIVFLLFLFYGEQIILLVYGADYIDSFIILLILGFGQLVYSWFGSGGYILLHRGHQTIFSIITIIASLIAILLSISFVDNYGVVAVASCYTLALLLQSIACALFCYFLEDVRVDADISGRTMLKLIQKQ